MRFRRRGILFLEGQIVFSVCVILSIILMIFEGKYLFPLLILSVFLLAVFELYFVFDEEYIVMNENGIACLKREKLCWAYQWSEIAELKIGNRFRNPSVDIVLNDDCCKFNYENEIYFQFGPAAKRAVKNYCKSPITKIN